MTRPTIRSIADRMGLSNATISLALRGHPRIPRETCERVKKTAEEMGYVPNPAISQLMTHIRSSRQVDTMTTVALLNANRKKNLSDKSAYHRQLLQGIETQGRELGYRIEPFWLMEKGMSPKRMSQILENRGIQGLIIPPSEIFGAKLALNWPIFSAVTAGYSLLEPRLNRIVGNQRQATFTCLHRLLESGHKRIGVVCHRNYDSRLTFITSSVHQWLQMLLPPRRRVPMLQIDDGGYSSLEDWVLRYRPDAVLSHISFMPELLANIGLNVPGDLSVIVQGIKTEETRVSGCYVPPLVIGQRMVKMLDSQLQHNDFGIPQRPVTILVEMQWEDGETLARRGPPDSLCGMLEHTAW